MPREIRDVAKDNPLFTQSASSTAIKLADGTYVDMVGTTTDKWVSDFATDGAQFDPLKWDTIRNTGMTVNSLGGQITVTTGAAVNNELLVLGKATLTIPANMSVVWYRTGATPLPLNSQAIRFGYVEVDPTTLLPVPHATLPGEFHNRVSIGQGRVSTADANTTMIMETVSSSSPVKQQAVGSQVATATAIEYALEARPEDMVGMSASADAGTIRGGSIARLNSNVPSPNRLYRPYIWILNRAGTTASLDVVVQRFLSMDVQELQVEVGGGRGNAAQSQSVPVFLTANPTISLANASVSTSSNGAATPHRKISTADTNLVTIKATAGKLVGGVIGNTTTTWKYVKFYNKATIPVLATDLPLFVVPVAPNSNEDLAAIFDQYGIVFGSGIGYAITGAPQDNDTTAVAVGDIVMSLMYV